MTQLSVRMGPGIARALGAGAADALVLTCPSDGEPGLVGALSRPAEHDVTIVVRVHTAAGIPVGEATMQARQGATELSASPLAFIGLEGYAHLGPRELAPIRARIWARRAYATAVRGRASRPC